MGLADDFDNWYDEEGSLVFGFGGYMVDKNATCEDGTCCCDELCKNITGTLYGNIVVTGTKGTQPVPEPATMLLFGVGLAGIAGFGRRKNKKSDC